MLRAGSYPPTRYRLPVNRIFHIARGPEWRDALADGAYAPPSIPAEGFIHLSTAGQLLGTLHRFYEEEEDMVLLVVDADALGPALRWDDIELDDRSVVTFPHLYRALDPAEVERIVAGSDSDDLEDGIHVLYARLGLQGHR